MHAPTVWHVYLQEDGISVLPATPPRTWHRFHAIYGEGYDWRPATEKEIADAKEWFRESHTHDEECQPQPNTPAGIWKNDP